MKRPVGLRRRIGAHLYAWTGHGWRHVCECDNPNHAGVHVKDLPDED